MSLSTRPIVGPVIDRVNGVPRRGALSTTVGDPARAVAALVCAGSAGVHAGLVTSHLHESVLLGILFALDAVLLGGAALRVSDPLGRTRDAVAAAAVLAATAFAYLLSRTSGLPGASEVESVDTLGAITTLSELVGAAACAFLIRRSRP